MFHRLWTLIRKELQSLFTRTANARDPDSACADSGHPVSVRRDA